MPLGIDPTVDYAFKKLFGDPDNSDLLIHLLNAVLTPDSPIVEAEILNPFNDKQFAEDKQSILDIKARDARGTWYNVEMQAKALGVLRRRLPYYNALLYVGQLSEGEGYELLASAITVCFLDDILFPGVEAPHLSFTLCDCRQEVQLSDCLQIHTVELPKYNFDEGSIGTADPLVQWSFFLSRAADFEASELKRMLPGRAYAKATGVIEMIARTPQEREVYEARRKAELDYKSFVTAARQEALEEGRQEGWQEGLKLGLARQTQWLQSLLGQPPESEDELMALDLDSLQRLCDELKDRLQPSE
jgi:predicted transposase/invertase (TIGR01784 family)